MFKNIAKRLIAAALMAIVLLSMASAETIDIAADTLSEDVQLEEALPTETDTLQPAQALEGIELSTQYPAMTVKAGDSLTFDLDLENNSGSSKDLNLEILSIPEGWSGSFSAGSKSVSVVHVKNEEDNTSIDFVLDIPLDAPDGEYLVELSASDDSGSANMELCLKVSAEEVGESSFEVEYPSQEGDASTEFTFSAVLTNNTLSDQSYAFTANAPAGWTVNFLPSGETTKVAALDVSARSTQGVDISVTPPSEIEAGTYEIPCCASCASEKLDVTLSVTVKGSYAVKLSTPSGRLSFDAYANQESAVQLTVTNTGNTDLTNVNLTSSAPSGWTVRFENETIELIETGATIETTAYITPGDEALSGDYETDITVKNSNASSSAAFRVSVKTETKWGVIGIIAILALVAAVFVVMRKFGRR